MVRTKINKYFKKETVMYKELDILEKIVKLAELQGIISSMEINLDIFKSKNGDKKKIKEVESMIKILKGVEEYLYMLFEQGSDSERYAFEVTKDNMRLRYENEKLEKEIKKVKDNL